MTTVEDNLMWCGITFHNSGPRTLKDMSAIINELIINRLLPAMMRRVVSNDLLLGEHKSSGSQTDTLVTDHFASCKYVT